MRIVLLNSCVVSRSTDTLQRDYLPIHPGTASIAAYLRSCGFEVAIIEPRLEQLNAMQVAERIVALAPDYVGYTAITEEVHDAAEIASEVRKRRAGIVNVVGGCHSSALPAETLRQFSAFDIAVRGEGELVFADIVRGVPLESIAEIAFRPDGGEPVFTAGQRVLAELDDLPVPAWDLYDVPRYRPPMMLELARACPNACTFCFHAVGRHVRYKSPERVLDEIERCVGVYGIRHMYFSTNGTWPLARAHCERVCEGIISRNLKIRWSTSTRVDRVDPELLALMRRSGCDLIDFGIESGSRDILGRSRKGIPPDAAIQAVEACHKLGIDVELNFLLGLPHENNETLQQTYNLVRRLRRYSTIANFSLLVPFPGTEIYEMALRNEAGLRIIDTDWRKYTKQRSGVLAYDNLSQEDLYAWQARMFRCYYFSVGKAFQVLRSRNARELFSLSRLFYMARSLFVSSHGQYGNARRVC